MAAVISFASLSALLLVFAVLRHLGSKEANSSVGGKAAGMNSAMMIYLPVVIGLAVCVWGYVVGKKVFEMSNDVNLIQKRMARYVLPRTLTPEAKGIISDYLSKFDPQPVVMKLVPRDEEAGSYRADLQQALEKGGWPVASILYDDSVQEGLGINVTTPMQQPAQQNPFDRLKPKKGPGDILREAFEKAGVIVSSSGGGSGVGIKETTVTISIGHRRRDKWAIPPPRDLLRVMGQPLPDDPDK